MVSEPLSNVLIAVPNSGWIRVELLPTLLPYMSRGARLVMPEGLKPAARARNECVAALYESECEWLWFVDHDVLPPEGALDALLLVGERVVTGVYANLKLDTDGIVKSVPLIARRDADGDMRVAWPPKANVERIDRCGAGCWLIHKSVFQEVGEPWFEERPWRTAAGEEPTGQDFIFGERLEKLKIPMFVCHSVVCRHKKEVDL